MTRYLVFTILGSILAFFILVTSPLNSRIQDIIGLIVLSLGTGLYLKNIRIAGLLTVIGIALDFHVISAWWFNAVIIQNWEIGIKLIILYVVLSTASVLLIGLAIYSTIKNTPLKNKLDKLNINKNMNKVLMTLPIIIILTEIIVVNTYLR